MEIKTKMRYHFTLIVGTRGKLQGEAFNYKAKSQMWKTWRTWRLLAITQTHKHIGMMYTVPHLHSCSNPELRSQKTNRVFSISSVGPLMGPETYIGTGPCNFFTSCYRLNICVPSQIHTLKPNPQYDGIRRWFGHEAEALMNRIRALTKETPERPLPPFAVCGHRGKMAV